MVSGWLIALGLFSAYLAFVVWLIRTGRLQKWNLSLLLGIILMIRTQRGKGILDWFARPARFWNVFADIGSVVTIVSMAFFTVVMLLLVPVALDKDSGAIALGAQEVLLIPGVNPFVPLVYGIIGLIVTLVVHEGGHGVLARANNLKVKSMGLLYAVVPVGAFVEPDEDELKATTRRKRLRVFAAGAFVNIVVAVLVVAAFGAMAEGLEPRDGAGIHGVIPDGPAERAGLAPLDVIVSGTAAGATTPIMSVDDAQAFLAERQPGQSVTFTLRDGSERQITLESAWSGLPERTQDEIQDGSDAALAYCRARGANSTDGAACEADLKATAFLGVRFFPAEDVHGGLSDPGAGGFRFAWIPIPQNFMFLVSLPIGEIQGAPVLSTIGHYYTTPWEGTWAEGLYIPLLLVLFWIFWINLLVGITNILPMLPLDGGHIFRDAAGAALDRLRPRMEAEARERVVGRLAVAVSLVILTAVLLQILGPHFV